MPITTTNLYEMIGAPLVAMIQGETLAAQATEEFIETVGFVSDPNAESDEYGKLRMVTFSYQKQDINGAAETVEMQLPILSLIPIPLLHIAEGEIEFGVKITDVITTSSGSNLRSIANNNYALNLPTSQIQGIVSTPLKFATQTQTQTDVQMNVRVKVAQADIPEGMKQLFRVFDVGVQSSVARLPPPPDNTGNNSDTNADTNADTNENNTENPQ